MAIDPVLKEFYQTLGGSDVLGKALTGLVEVDGRKCQYVEAALMCVNPAGSEAATRYQLEPLGISLHVSDDPQFPPPPNTGSQDVGGFILFDEFAPMYEHLYGDLYAGKPLSNLRVNRDNHRYEQFFENIGFYRNFSDPVGKVHLIPYGSYVCGPDCSQNLDEYWRIVSSGKINQPFELSLQHLGWQNYGRPLAQPLLTDDGMLEQVYENVVLYAPLDDLSDIHLRPLLLWMGIVPVQPSVEKNPHEQLVFYPTQNGLGHNVPVFFDEFIASHGGREMAGLPITELFPVEDGQKYCQCFENYCLDYDPQASPDRRVYLKDMGRQYLLSTQPDSLARREFSAEAFDLTLTEKLPQVGQGEQQELILQVHDRKTAEPQALVSAQASVHLPDKPSMELPFPPTDASGQSVVTLPPLDGLANMSVVEYQVCLLFPDAPRICSVDSFIYRGK